MSGMRVMLNACATAPGLLLDYKSHDQLHQRRFARAVLAQQAERHPLANIEVKVAERGSAPGIGFAEIDAFNDGSRLHRIAPYLAVLR